MSIPSKQIGWSNESNLLWQISKQLEQLTGVTSKIVIPTPAYSVYTALVTWDDTGLIDLNVLENTLGGDLVFTCYPSADFTINSIDNLFTTGKTFVLMNSFYTGGDYGIGTAAECAAVDTINVSFDTYGSGPVATTRTGFIEIRVYN